MLATDTEVAKIVNQGNASVDAHFFTKLWQIERARWDHLP